MDDPISQEKEATLSTEPVKEASNKPDDNETIPPMTAYLRLWSFATPLDVFLRILGAVASAGSGTAEPLMSLFFGDLVNLFNGSPPKSPEDFRSEVNRLSLYFVFLFIGKFVVSISP